MKRPNLQIALDHNSLEDALADCMKVGEIVDIIEVGTILCLQEGQKAIRCLKRMFPNKTIVADTKCHDGHLLRHLANDGCSSKRSPRITSRTIWRLDNATSSTMARIRD